MPSNPQPERSFTYRIARDGGAGGLASAVESAITFPLLRWYTIQQQSKGAVTPRLPQVARQLWGAGGFRVVYRGVDAEVLKRAPQRAGKFAVFTLAYDAYRWGGGEDSPLAAAAAGGTAGLLEGARTPFEYWRVALGTPGSKLGGTMWSAARATQAGHGFLGHWQGLGATALVSGAWTTVYFGLITLARKQTPEPDSSAGQAARNISIGAGSGVVGGWASQPFEVVKSRQQQPLMPRQRVRLFGVTKALGEIWRTEGLRAFTKGAAVKSARYGVGGAILWPLAEVAKRVFDRHFDPPEFGESTEPSAPQPETTTTDHNSYSLIDMQVYGPRPQQWPTVDPIVKSDRTADTRKKGVEPGVSLAKAASVHGIHGVGRQQEPLSQATEETSAPSSSRG